MANISTSNPTTKIRYYKSRKGRGYFELGKQRAQFVGMKASYPLGPDGELAEQAAVELYQEWRERSKTMNPAYIELCRQALNQEASRINEEKMSYQYYLDNIHRPNFIYIMKADNLLKVGYTCAPVTRLSDIPREYDCKDVAIVSLYRLDKNIHPPKAETAAHRLLSSYRVYGEFFDCPLSVAQDAIARGIASIKWGLEAL